MTEPSDALAGQPAEDPEPGSAAHRRGQGTPQPRAAADELARARAELRASQALIAAVLDHSPLAVVVLDPDLRVRRVNRAAQSLFGAGAHPGRPLADVLRESWPEAEAAEVHTRLARVLVTGEPDSGRRFAAFRRDRDLREHYEWEARRFSFPDATSGVIWFVADISAHVRTEAAIKASEQRERETAHRLQLTLKAGHLGDWSFDVAQDAVTIGAPAAGWFGLPAGRPVAAARARERIHPADQTWVREAFDEALRRRADYEVDYRIRLPDGEEKWLATRARPVYSDDGTAIGMAGIVQDITDRKKLEVLQERLAAVVESSDDAIVSKDLDGVVQTWNAGAQRIFGYTPEEMVGQPITRIIPPELHPEEVTILRRLRNGERIQHYDTVRVTKDGRRIAISLTVSPVHDASGRIVGASKVARDVTARKQAEAELRRSEEELRALADSIPQLAWIARGDGDVYWYNRGWYDYTGTRPEQVEGWGWQSVHDPAVLPAVLTQWRECLVQGTPFEMEFPLRGTGGEYRWFLTRIRPIRDARGRVIRWFGTSTDVDEVKRTREALWDESRLLNLLNETGKSIAADLDLQSLAQTVTEASTRLSGAEFGAFFAAAESAPGGALDLRATAAGAPGRSGRLGPPDAASLSAPAFSGSGSIRYADIQAEAPAGTPPPRLGVPPGCRSYLAAPIVSRGGDRMGALVLGHSTPGVFTDRIERLIVGLAAQAAVALDNARLYERVKRAAQERQELLEAERSARAQAERVSMLKDEFLATLSHELRTPLNAIVGWSQVLRQRGQGDQDLLEGLAVIDRNARVQAQLIEDLLDMSRITAGKLRLDVQRVDVQDVVRAAVASVRHTAEAKNIRLHAVLDPAAGPVWGDPGRLQQCAWNLLANAIKFTPKGGHVTVRLMRVNSHLELSVADDGQGIAADFLPHVFERFRQGDASTTRRHGGLGLGLSIVKSLVELHGGSVRVSSPGPGQGSTFFVELPLMVVDAPPPEGGRVHPRSPLAPPPAMDPSSLLGTTVLVVDDEVDARTLVKRLLEDCGARVFLAASAREGLELLQRERPAVVLSDIGMPDEDGYTFMRRVRALTPDAGGRTPAVALSAFARAEDRTRALRAGYQIHLAKPVDPTELTAVIASLAARP
jgi:PAS domain S-box-containing protein